MTYAGRGQEGGGWSGTYGVGVKQPGAEGLPASAELSQREVTTELVEGQRTQATGTIDKKRQLVVVSCTSRSSTTMLLFTSMPAVN